MEEKLLKMMEYGNNQYAYYLNYKKRKLIREQKYNEFINEAYGSFPGQYEKVKKIAEKLIDKWANGDYVKQGVLCQMRTTEFDDNFGKVIYILNFHCLPYDPDFDVTGIKNVDESGNTIIALSVEGNSLYEENMASTLGHEIMHLFQTTLKNAGNVNEKSMILYHNLPSFYGSAPSDLTGSFFFGLYICYQIERTANISSISNYLQQYFKKTKEKVTTKSLMTALHNCKKYKIYEEVLNDLQTLSWHMNDKQYVVSCMTKMMKNPYSNQYVQLYNKENFNVDIFINKNIKNICNTCKETMDKMVKNMMIYVEEIEDEQEKLKKQKNKKKN